MKYTNYKKIAGIKFLYPELMSEDAQNKVVALFEKIQMTKDMIAETTMLSEELKKQLDKYEKEWNKISAIVEVQYVVEDKDEIKNNVNIGFNFGTEINNHLH